MNVIYEPDWDELDEQAAWFAYLQECMELQKGGEGDASARGEGEGTQNESS